MHNQQQLRRSSGSKAIALDGRVALARYRLLQLLALVLTAASAIGLRIIFGH